MKSLYLLDAGPLGMISNPKAKSEAWDCNIWLEEVLLTGFIVGIPEIADYEIRRDLIRTNKLNSISRLNILKEKLLYFPITTMVMLKAAEFWAHCRNQGKPTAPAEALDCDVIIAAQARILDETGYDVTVVTTNTRHISQFVKASIWQNL